MSRIVQWFQQLVLTPGGLTEADIVEVCSEVVVVGASYVAARMDDPDLTAVEEHAMRTIKAYEETDLSVWERLLVAVTVAHSLVLAAIESLREQVEGDNKEDANVKEKVEEPVGA